MRKTAILILSLAALACARGGDEARERASVPPAAPDSAPGAPGWYSPPDLDTAGRPEETPAPAAQPSPGTEAPARGPGAAPPEPAQGDSATLVLERAAAKYAALRSLQAEFTMSFENPLLRTRTEGRGTLYQKRPDRLLLRFREPAGDIILSDGEYFWLYYPSVEREQVIRSAAGAGDASGVDLQAQFLGDPTRRFRYTLDREESVAGRKAWAMTLLPRERMGYRRLRVWIDQADYLVRRFEITEDNGSVRRFELRDLEPGASLSDALFRFDVPAGVRVITR